MSIHQTTSNSEIKKRIKNSKQEKQITSDNQRNEKMLRKRQQQYKQRKFVNSFVIKTHKYFLQHSD